MRSVLEWLHPVPALCPGRPLVWGLGGMLLGGRVLTGSQAKIVHVRACLDVHMLAWQGAALTHRDGGRLINGQGGVRA